MKKSVKILVCCLLVALIAAASVLGTLAYLTARDTVTNTFTVGQVDIKLDEAKVLLAEDLLDTSGKIPIM